ncbi:MAG: hypothetical protein ABW292_07740 [Vicinamibacterales bacterium]
MTLKNIKATTAALWVFAMGAAAVVADVTSFSSWLVLAGCAIVPPFVMMRYWNPPDRTMSESIQQVLR